MGRAEDAIIATSNYRLHIKFKESVVNVSISEKRAMRPDVMMSHSGEQLEKELHVVSVEECVCMWGGGHQDSQS